MVFERQRLTNTPPRPVVFNLLSAIILCIHCTKHCRSEWGRGKALACNTIGRGFAPRQNLSFSHVDVGDAFQFINHISAERYTCEKKKRTSLAGGEPPISGFQFKSLIPADALLNHQRETDSFMVCCISP